MTILEAKNQILLMDRYNEDYLCIDGINIYKFEKFEDDFAIFNSFKFSVNELALLRMHLPLECFYIRSLVRWIKDDSTLGEKYFLINPHGEKEFSLTYYYNDEDGNYICDDGKSGNFYFWRLDVRSYTSPTIWNREEVGCFMSLEDGQEYIKNLYEK